MKIDQDARSVVLLFSKANMFLSIIPALGFFFLPNRRGFTWRFVFLGMDQVVIVLFSLFHQLMSTFRNYDIKIGAFRIHPL